MRLVVCTDTRRTYSTHLADVVVEVDVELEAVVGPRAELEFTSLYVVRKLGDVDRTRAAKQRRWYPQHRSIAVNQRHRVTKLLQSHIRTT